MIMNDIKASKRIAFLLRHGAKQEGVPMDKQGWVLVDDLLAWLSRDGPSGFDATQVARVVETNDKHRFELDGGKIRALQGHTLNLDLQLPPATPRPILYHGTGTRYVKDIMAKGLLKMGRQHVHLSCTVDQALNVGKRHGQPVVLQVNAVVMARDTRSTRR
jgi:putative RNA 2'-phosphotransferase